MIAICFALSLLSFVSGYILCGYLISSDPSLIRVNGDEMVVKKPPDDLILVALAPSVARRVVMQSGEEKNGSEARDLYRL